MSRGAAVGERVEIKASGQKPLAALHLVGGHRLAPVVSGPQELGFQRFREGLPAHAGPMSELGCRSVEGAGRKQ